MNFIWDLDGTLINSYPAILEKMSKVSKELGLDYSKDFIYKEIIKESVGTFNHFISKENNIPLDKVYEVYRKYEDDINLITIMPNLINFLNYSISKGDKHFIFTNRRESAYKIVDHLKLNEYFVEVVVVNDFIPYKPDPGGINYLINKYNLNKDETYYVGDRRIDIDCASNAGIKAIFYNSSGIDVNSGAIILKINDLNELINFKG